MIQGQPPHLYKWKSLTDSFNQYLPKEDLQGDYALLVNYCTRLEKEVQDLKHQLRIQIQCNKQLTLKSQRQTPAASNSTSLLNSFQSVNRAHYIKDRAKQAQKQDELGLHFQQEMIVMLKQENSILSEKIKQLYQQNQRLLVQKIGKENKNQCLDHGLPFNKINLNPDADPTVIKHKVHDKSKQAHLPPQQLNQKLHLLHRKIVNSNQARFDLAEYLYM